MKGLDQDELEVMEIAGTDRRENASPARARAARRMAARGLIILVESVDGGGMLLQTIDITPLGRLALRIKHAELGARRVA